jgi:3-deoxy-D-manno-octulosonic-acid transferase
MENFREVAALFLNSGAGAQVPDAAGLAAAVLKLAGSEASRSEMGRCGTRLLQQCSGATERHLEIAAALLAAAGSGGAAGSRSGAPR